MKTIRFLLAAALVAAFLLPEASWAGTRIFVHSAPPAPKKVVVVAKRPYHNAIWVTGFWRWQAGRYVWVDGYWVRPRKGFVYVPGHWQHARQGWFWVEGHWRRI